MFKTISAKLNFLFTFALIAILLLFLITDEALQQRAMNDELSRLSLLKNYIDRTNPSPEQIAKIFQEVDFYRLKKDLDIKVLRKKATNYKDFEFSTGKLHGFFYAGDFYVDYVDAAGNERLYQSINHPQKFTSALLGSCAASVVILVLLYVLLRRHLKPIHQLSLSMQKYSNGEKFEPIKIQANDEINELAESINTATARIDSLIASRQFFLRAIMHELKTPIGKGRILNALPASEQNKARMDDIFTRLDLLVNEFAQVEKVLSLDYELQLKDYRCSLVYEQALDLLMCENPDYFSAELGNDEIVNVDLNLFSMMLKNLLDNALKYSVKKPVYVIFNNNLLSVRNYGRPLDEGLKNLSMAFIQGDESQPGLGLGLYLIGRIVRMHGFSFDYVYENEMHHFNVRLNGAK